MSRSEIWCSRRASKHINSYYIFIYLRVRSYCTPFSSSMHGCTDSVAGDARGQHKSESKNAGHPSNGFYIYIYGLRIKSQKDTFHLSTYRNISHVPFHLHQLYVCVCCVFSFGKKYYSLLRLSSALRLHYTQRRRRAQTIFPYNNLWA